MKIKNIILTVLVIIFLINMVNAFKPCKICNDNFDNSGYFNVIPRWAKIYGKKLGDRPIMIGTPLGISSTKDGYYYVVGYIVQAAGGGGKDFWVIKLDELGNVIWQKAYGGRYDDQADSVKGTDDGGCIVGGWTESFSKGVIDFWIIKLDASGNIQWEKSYGGYKQEGFWGVWVSPDRNGGYIVDGTTESFGAGKGNIWVLRLNAAGDIIWQKTYGGNLYDNAWPIISDTDGNYIMSGVNESFSPDGSGHIWVLKLNQNGDIIWQKLYYGKEIEGAQISTTNDGGYFLGGASGRGQEADILAMKLDSSGNIVWQKNYIGSKDDLCPGSKQLPDGSFALGCYTNASISNAPDFLIVKLNSLGNIQWQKTYGGQYEDEATAIDFTLDGGLIITGRANSFLESMGVFEVIKVDSNGNIGNSCPIVNNFYAKEAAANLQVKNTSSVPRNTYAEPMVTNAIVTDTSGKTGILCIAGLSFEITCSPTNLPFLLRTSNCTIKSSDNFAGIINLNCTGLPAGAECQFSPNPVMPIMNSSTTSKLIVKLNSNVPAGIYPFKVVGTSGNIKRYFDLTLTVIRR